MRPTKSQRQQREAEHSERHRQQREQLGLEQVPESLCPKHSWRPFIRVRTLAPPRSECPGCLAEATRALGADRGEARVLLHPGTTRTPEQHDLMARYEELERQRHPDRVAPGSAEEDEALQRISDARDAEREREERRQHPQRVGQLVSARSEGGVYVEYRAIRGRGIVRVAS